MSTLSHTRPGEHRWIDPKAFLKPNLKQHAVGWLGEEWKRTTGKDYPTVYDILSGIQNQEEKNMRELHKDCKNKEYLNVLINNKRYAWKHIFQSTITSDFNRAITEDSLKNPSSEILCLLLWIYSMECFVYKQLNAATRDNDQSYVATLGPMCLCLGTIIEGAESSAPEDCTVVP